MREGIRLRGRRHLEEKGWRYGKEVGMDMERCRRGKKGERAAREVEKCIQEGSGREGK